jgi:dTDP-4-dehydrorhamnose 3,5-epimerase-like enzyme
MKYAIPDLYIRTLSSASLPGVRRMLALRESDHVLRRFGEAEVLRLDPGASPGIVLHLVADEVWALLEGSIEAFWQDRRPRSPSRGARVRDRFLSPVLMLAPFGVAFGVRALDEGAMLARFATHMQDDPECREDLHLPWEDGP